jgi:hypothetical protein
MYTDKFAKARDTHTQSETQRPREAAAYMSRREDRDSDSKRHRSRFDREHRCSSSLPLIYYSNKILHLSIYIGEISEMKLVGLFVLIIKL